MTDRPFADPSDPSERTMPSRAQGLFGTRWSTGLSGNQIVPLVAALLVSGAIVFAAEALRPLRF